MSSEATPLSPNKQALLKIRELKRQLEQAQRAHASNGSYEPIAIVSMACRFPKSADTPEKFWQLLMNQEDLVGEIPGDRWDLDAFHDDDPNTPGRMYARNGVFLDQLDQMDPEFFGISPREATWVDPQQRLLMEVGWEAIERAGWTPERIADQTGVFVGWMHNDFQNEASDSFLNLNPYIATGAAGSFLCGRLAYYLGLQGPSVAIDTACSSSLVALHLAIQSLQRRDCDRALVGGVNAICSPTTNILTCKLKALSPTGQSRAFDAAADGYLRGEGCGVITLRRLEDATANGDPVLGIIRGSAVGHNGFSSGLTAPNPKAQEKVIRQALKLADIEPREVAYLEAHGTGTELGDPIEMQAASAALAEKRSFDHPLFVGSVKTNIGHLEAAAGMAGLIKVLLSMQQNKIPGQLNFETPNPHIPWDKIPVQVLTDAIEWPSFQDRRIAGVSAFGMSGTNAHVVIEAPESSPSGSPATPPKKQSPEPDNNSTSPTPSQIVTISGKTEDAVLDLAKKYDSALSESNWTIADLSLTTGTRRAHFEHRVAFVGESKAEIVDEIQQFIRGTKSSDFFQGHSRKQPKIAWQFTGQGSQYVGMARQLYDHQPVFRDAINQCEDQVQHLRQASLLEVLFPENPDDERIHNTQWTQPAIFGVQMGIVRLLKSWGLEPDLVLGHSVGQFAAACVAGIMSWQDGMHLICERGRLIGSLPTGGSMLAVFGSVQQVQDGLANFDDLSIAAHNGTHIVISGRDSSIENASAYLTSSGIRSKKLVTSHAFHSELMEPILAEFRSIADKIKYSSPNLPLVCNVNGEVLNADATLDGRYWAKHIRQPVCYSQSIVTTQELGCELMLEIGPQAILTRMASAVWQRPTNTLVSCLAKDQDDQRSLKRAVARLYVDGARPDFSAMHRDTPARPMMLPTYPFQRRRFWGPDKPRAAHVEHHTAHPLLGSQIRLAGNGQQLRYESHVDTDSPAWVSDHEVMGQIVMPGAALVEQALAAAELKPLQDIHFDQPLALTCRTPVQTVVNTSDQTVEIYSLSDSQDKWKRHFHARLGAEPAEKPAPIDRDSIADRLKQRVDSQTFYETLANLGLNYGATFQTVRDVRFSQNEVLAHLRSETDIRGYRVLPNLLDGALHSLAAGLVNENSDDLFLPVGIGKFESYSEIHDEFWCHAEWEQNDGPTRTANLTLFANDGQVLATIENLTVKQINLEALRRISGTRQKSSIYDLQWETIRLNEQPISGSQWLIVRTGNENSTANQIQSELESRGHRTLSVVLEKPGTFDDGFSVEETNIRVQPQNADNWLELQNHLVETNVTVDGIVWLLKSDVDSNAFDYQETHVSGILNLAKSSSPTQRNGTSPLANLRCGLQLVTTDGVNTIPVEGPRIRPDQGQYWGLGRVIGAERPDLNCRVLDIPSGNAQEEVEYVKRLADVLLTPTEDNQLAIRQGQFMAPRMTTIPVVPPSNKENSSSFQWNPNGSYLVTGGVGMLGRHVARWLVQNGAGQVILLSRRIPEESVQDEIRQTCIPNDAVEFDPANLVFMAADASSRPDMESLFSRFGNDLRQLSGVVHAAGVLDDGLLETQEWSRFEKVLAPKVGAGKLLHELTQDHDLDLFVLFSSVASVLGSPGQSNYAMGNAYLDSLAWHRRQIGLPAISINWGPWEDGMADDEKIRKRLSLQGITPLTAEHAMRAMDQLIKTGQTQASVIEVQWQRLRLGAATQTPPLLKRLVANRKRSSNATSALVSRLLKLSGAAQREFLLTTIQESLQRILSTDGKPETDRPLIELGLDSLMAVEFGTELQEMLGERYSVGPTMLFDHPTIDAITDHVLELIRAEAGESVDASDKAPAANVDKQQPPATPSTTREPVAIVGMSCRFPGAEDLEQFWQNLLNGVDSVREIPDDRWDIERFYSDEPEPGKMYTREGGFLEDIGEFDASFFNIPEQEACWIDPQHRMLLENSYRAMEHAGIPTHPLKDSNVGVFMGIMGQDYAFLPTLDDHEVLAGFQGAGLSHSAGVGRISYLFGFEGPSVAVDTASSSSLVAVHQAVRSLQDGNCNMALAGGVNAILAPVNSLLMSKAKLLSPDGRCKSFSAAANGFGRGEGCGVVVLKRLSDAQRDGDRVLAVIRGGAVVHNGFTGGITTPSSKSQVRVITQALEDAQLAPSEVQYLEAHGTGTEYGDPMEIGAAAKAYGRGRPRTEPLLVGSVKANISHLEAAGGASGLIKTVLALHHGIIPPQIHLDEPSPHIPWNRVPLKMVQEQTEWPAGPERIAGVTALGLVGTNAHLVLSSGIAENEDSPTENAVVKNKVKTWSRDRELLTLSARTPEALIQLVEKYRNLLTEADDNELQNVCYSSATGRRQMEFRLAISCSTREEALHKLSAFHNQNSGLRHEQSNGAATQNGSLEGGLRSTQFTLNDSFTFGVVKSGLKTCWLFDDVDAPDLSDALRSLTRSEPIVAQFFDDLENRLRDHTGATGEPLSEALDTSPSPNSDLVQFLLQACLAKLFSSLQITPECVAGFGVGQYVASCVAGGLCFFDALILVYERERIGTPDGLTPETFESLADTFNYYPPNLPLVCSLSGEEVAVHKSLAGSYWREHLTGTPERDASLETLFDNSMDIVIEFGTGTNVSSHPELNRPGQRILVDNSENLMNALAALYVRGLTPDFSMFYSGYNRQRTDLPVYPFQRKRYWITEISKFMQPEPVEAKANHG